MTHDHIVKSFDADLNRLDHIIAEMGGLAEAQLADAIDALVTRDGERATQVIAADRRIDDLEREVDVQVIRMLALRQPMADDLRVVIASLRTSSIIERIGDYAKNVSKRTVALAQTPPLVAAYGSVSRMGRVVQEMIKNVLDAYLVRDLAKAEDVRCRDGEVDSMHSSLFREMLTYMMEDPRSITSCAHLLFVAKNIERIGDLATNISEQVHFLVMGEIPDDDRPKGDSSSYMVIDPTRQEAKPKP